MDKVDFQLTESDQTVLTELCASARRTRFMGTIMVSVLIAICVYIVVSEPTWWIVALTVPSLLGVAFIILRFKMFRGSGSAQRILAGGKPVMVLSGTMVDADGDSPNPLTLELDTPNDAIGFVYFGKNDPSWLQRPGSRFTMYLFWDLFPLYGIVCIDDIDSGRRHWIETPNHGITRAYRND